MAASVYPAIEPGQAIWVRRFVAQSYFAVYARTGAAVRSEEDPLDTAPAREMREDKLVHLGTVADLAALLRSARLSGSANPPRS